MMRDDLEEVERSVRKPSRLADVNAVVGGYLRDLAFAQPTQPKMFGYKRAAAAIFALETQLTELIADDGTLPRIAGIGPGSTRVIREVLETGGSPTVDAAVAGSERRTDIERRRSLRRHFLSRAEVLRILRDPAFGGPDREAYRGDLQMHSEWSDGSPSLAEIAEACVARGYAYAAVTDHSYGLKIAGGMSMAEAAEQKRVVDRVNADHAGRFRLLQGIEANIGADGQLDLNEVEARSFEIVLAAPHSQLRKTARSDQPARRRNRESSGSCVGASARPDHRLACGDCGRLGCRISGGLPTRRRHRDRRRPGATGYRPHAGRSGARGQLHLCPRQRRSHHDPARLCGDRPRPRQARGHSTRTYRQLLAA